MNQALKQRLVGALVLLALGVIFLPALFNGGRPRQVDEMKEIPPPPAVEALAFVEPERPAGFADEAVKPVEQLYAPTPASPRGEEMVEKHPPPPGLEKNGLPGAWVLQVASFSEATKADELKKALQAKHYKAFTRSIRRDNKTVVRVLIGPELDASRLASAKKAVDRDFKVNSIVVKFES